jgi:hypothetical protein
MYRRRRGVRSTSHSTGPTSNTVPNTEPATTPPRQVVHVDQHRTGHPGEIGADALRRVVESPAAASVGLKAGGAWRPARSPRPSAPVPARRQRNEPSRARPRFGRRPRPAGRSRGADRSGGPVNARFPPLPDPATNALEPARLQPVRLGGPEHDPVHRLDRSGPIPQVVDERNEDGILDATDRDGLGSGPTAAPGRRPRARAPRRWC